MSDVNPTDQGNQHPEDSYSPPKQGHRRFFQRPWVIITGAVIIALGCFYGMRYLINSRTHESTDDAFIEADIVSLSPKVAGQVSTVFVDDNRFVEQGALLVEIDPRDYQVRVNERQAALQSAMTSLSTASNNLQVAHSRVDSAEATRAQRQAQAEAAQATASRAENDLRRNQELLKNQTISSQEFDAARTAAIAAQANFEAAHQQVAVADSAVAEAQNQVGIAQAQVKQAQAQIKQAQADLQAAELDLSYTKVLSPIPGRVTRKAVERGSYLQVGQIMLALVPTNIWVIANFKETQLVNMRPGQPVTINVSAYSKNSYRGHVDSIQAGSGSRFSLLPPENAVGNFVKVVQRVPVKIIFDEPLNANQVFGPGMSVVPSVQIKNWTVPSWIFWLVAVIAGILVGLFGLRWAAKHRNNENPAGNLNHEPAKA
ncbi:MAG: Efflux transporter, family, subunit [Pedosphaera sp.]|nr:Efflux transporter, family, subunit [Pedosphaera sp.]